MGSYSLFMPLSPRFSLVSRFSVSAFAHLLRKAAFAAVSVFTLVYATSAALGADTWKAGIATQEITPQTPMWMTGYGFRERPADGTSLKLNAKALALSDPQGKLAVLITADVCGVTRAISDRVAAQLAKSHSLPRSAVMINVSHTHCSPFVEGYLEGLREFPEPVREQIKAYRIWLEEQFVAVATEALNNLQPVVLSSSEDSADFAVNRRNNPAAQVVERRAAGTLVGPVDHRVPILALRSPEGNLVGVVTSYACHNTTLSFYEWHGDYAGVAQRELEHRHAGATAFFTAGCGADSNPLPRGELSHVETYGKALADAVDRALNKSPVAVQGTFASAWSDLSLAFDHLPTEDEINKAAASPQAIERLWSKRMQARLQQGSISLTYAYPMQAWRIGNVSWLALGGETVVDYSLRLRSENPGNLWVLGYSNDVMGYIPSERVLKEGGYEGLTSMRVYDQPSGWATGLENRISSQASELLKQVSR